LHDSQIFLSVFCTNIFAANAWRLNTYMKPGSSHCLLLARDLSLRSGRLISFDLQRLGDYVNVLQSGASVEKYDFVCRLQELLLQQDFVRRK